MICSKCKNKIGFNKGLVLKNFNEQVNLCQDCYISIPKEEKKLMTAISGKINFLNIATGLAVGGIIGAIAFNSGYNRGQDMVIEHSMRKYNYTGKQLNDFSIDKFNSHFRFLDDYRSRAVLDHFEGKTNSKYYRKYIFNEHLKTIEIEQKELTELEKTQKRIKELEQLEKKLKNNY